MAMRSVQNSLRFAFLCDTIIRSVPINETATANTGLTEMIVSMS